MESVLYYLLKVNIALAAFYIAYRLLFRNDTFFRMRRFVLLGIYLTAFLYPLPDFSLWLSSHTELVGGVAYYYAALLPRDFVQVTAGGTPTPGWQPVLMIGLAGLYLAGICVLLRRRAAELVILLRTRKTSSKHIQNGYKYYQPLQPEAPYSFFGWIFLHPDVLAGNVTAGEVLMHEATHVREWHSADVLLGEAACILCWVNPFAWLLKREIRLNHEYIADRAVIHAGYDRKTYQYHLVGLERPSMAAAKLYNNFSVLPLKRRITMLNKKRTHVAGRIKYLALLPLLLCLLLMNNLDATARIQAEQLLTAVGVPSGDPELLVVPPQQEDPVYTVAEVMPSFPGGNSELIKYIHANLKYPEAAQQQGIQGRVIVTYVVEKDGSITQAEIIRSLDPLLDAEAIRVINSMPKWTPGKDKGKTVRVKYTVPAVFKLQ